MNIINFKSKSFWYILLFSILYTIVAFSSFYHACAFFGLANNSWMSIILAFAFEIGQAAVLFSLLTSKKDRSRIMPWVLMSMFTLVQVIGNIFSSYKYIINNSVENLRYFKEPIFIWTNLPDDQATVIIVYIVGAILPIAALLLTSMITNYLSDQEELKNNSCISDETKDKLNNLLQEALDKTTEKDFDEFLDDKSKEEEKPQEKNKELEQQVKEEKVETESINEESKNDDLKDLQESLNSKDNKIEKLKEDHDKILNEKVEKEKQLEEALEKTGDLNKSLVEKNNEIENLKKELEELKHPKITQIPAYEIVHNQPMEEPEGLKQSKENTDENSIEHIKEPNGQESDTGESKPGVDDTISEGTEVEETTKEELVKEPVEENIQKRESHFINI